MEDLPKFLKNGAFNWRSIGYHYVLDKNEVERVKLGDDDNPWFVIAHVVDRAKQGDFSKCSNLAKFFDQNLETNAAPAAMLITGDIGKKEDLKKLTEIMKKGPDGFRVYACKAAANSGCMWMIPYMLEAWHLVEGVDAHENIGYSIADMLDSIESLDEVGTIGSRVGVFTTKFELSQFKFDKLNEKSNNKADAIFHDIVMEQYQQLKNKFPNDDAIIWAGKGRCMYEFAQYFLNMITTRNFNFNQIPLVVPLRHKFEAATGINCSSFFEGDRFHQINAVSILESFLDGSDSKKYQKHKRYFFGYVIE
jgi:peroxiredoxin family protein